MLRILYVSAVAERGGQEASLLSIVRHIDRSRFLPVVLLLEQGQLCKELESAGAQIRVIPSGRVRELTGVARTIAQAVKLIRDDEIDIVHTLNSKAHLYGGVSALVARVPCLYHLHGVPTPSVSRDGVVSLLSFIIPARRTLACSAYVAKEFKHVWRTGREIVVIHNGVADLRTQADEGPSVREELGICDGAPVVMMACRLQRQKGVHIFLQAAVEVVTRHPEARFVIVGGSLFGLEPEYPASLRQEARELGLTRSVIFTGYRADAHRLIAAADLIVHSAIGPDSLPIVLLEAGMLKKAAVATDLGGPNEIIEHGVTGLLVRPNSAEELARGILDLLDSRDRRERMGEAAGERIREHFAIGQMVRHLEKLYGELVSRSVRAPS